MGFWEWVAYTALFIAASIIAADTSLRLSPTLMEYFPNFFNSVLWGFAPLALVLIATAILVSKEFGWIGFSSKLEKKFIFHNIPPHVVVSKKTFINERVILDGHAYRDCTFENVTFVFNGTEPFEISGNTIHGKIQVASDNPSVFSTFMLLRGLGFIDQVDFRNDSGSRIDVPARAPILPKAK